MLCHVMSCHGMVFETLIAYAAADFGKAEWMVGMEGWRDGGMGRMADVVSCNNGSATKQASMVCHITCHAWCQVMWLLWQLFLLLLLLRLLVPLLLPLLLCSSPCFCCLCWSPVSASAVASVSASPAVPASRRVASSPPSRWLGSGLPQAGARARDGALVLSVAPSASVSAPSSGSGSPRLASQTKRRLGQGLLVRKAVVPFPARLAWGEAGAVASGSGSRSVP